MTFLQMYHEIRLLKGNHEDINPVVLKIYNKARRAANKVIKEELGDIEPWRIRWTDQGND